MSGLQSAALGYARAGWPVFPIIPRDKNPITPNGFKDATTDGDRVRQWWEQHPGANIGLVPGRAGLIVIDIGAPDFNRGRK